MSVQDFVILLQMLQAERPEYWIGMFFVTGLVFGIGSAIAVGFLWSRQRKLFLRKAEEANVILDIPTGTAEGVYAIEGCGYCIGFIIIAVAGVLGISLPVLLPEGAEDMIVVVVITVFGALLWGLAVWSVPYYRSEKRRFQSLLDEAIEKASE